MGDVVEGEGLCFGFVIDVGLDGRGVIFGRGGGTSAS